MRPSEIESDVKRVESRFSDQLGVSATVLDSATWFREKFDSCGDWDSWVWETVTGKDYGTRRRHFDGFVVLGDRLGKASAGIADLALRNGRAVLAWKEPDFQTVKTVSVLDAEDVRAGWTIGTAQIGG